MKYNIFQVANTILKIAKSKNIDINNTKLQKLCYFSHGFYLGIYNEPLISDPVIAYTYGPYYPNLFQAYKDVEKTEKNKIITIIKLDDNCNYEPIDNNDNVIKLIEEVLDSYGNLTATQLTTLSHKSDTPWNKTEQGNIIDNEITKKYYERVQHDRY